MHRLLLCVLLGLPLHAQAQNATAPVNPNPSTPSYDVSTVRPNRTAAGGSSLDAHNGTLRGLNVNLETLLLVAFRVQRYAIEGLPAWGKEARFDIDAKDTGFSLGQQLSAEQQQAMLRQLLEQRFALKWHRATGILPATALMVDKRGAKIHHTTPAQAATGNQGTFVHNHTMDIRNVPLSAFCQELSGEVQRPVLDRTGLTGNYTVTLRFTSESAIDRAGDAGLPVDAPPPLATALPEQLGLHLISTKAPVEVLVIDSISPPTAN